MFGRKPAQKTPPVTEEHLNLTMSLQESFAAAQNLASAAEALLGFQKAAKDATTAQEKITEEARNFFKDKDDKYAVKLALTKTAALVSSVALISIFSAPIAFSAALVLLVSTPMIFDRQSKVDKNLQAFRETSSPLQSLKKLINDISTARTALFETPATINAIVASPKFPEAFEIASENEKKVLVFAFRAAVESREGAKQPPTAAPAHRMSL